jgi:hypothetical protein
VRGTTRAMTLITGKIHSPRKRNWRYAECQNVDHPFHLVALTISDLSYATASQVQESEFVASLTTGKWLKETIHLDKQCNDESRKAPNVRQSRAVEGLKKLKANMIKTAELMMTSVHKP